MILRRGFTLVELLVSTVITLLIVYGLAQAFSEISGTISLSRASFEMSGSLRGVSLRLQQDLEGLTIPVRPWPSAASDLGYFEYYEGPESDYYPVTPAPSSVTRAETHVGDYDDILMFTARNRDFPFEGRIQTGYRGSVAPRSTVAEIIWWTSLNDLDGNGRWDPRERFTLHRRVLLVLPELNNNGNLPSWAPGIAIAQFAQFINDNDLSVHLEATTVAGSPALKVVANTLSDLTHRANRFAHLPYNNYGQGGFPYLIDLQNGFANREGLLRTSYVLSGSRIGEDVVASQVVGFDVRAFDPYAVIYQDKTDAIDPLVPGDPGYVTAAAATAPAPVQLGSGAYVDLNYAGSALSLFSGPPDIRSGLSGSSSPAPPYFQPARATYDTWSTQYEQDGVNQDFGSAVALNLFPPAFRDALIDEGTDGIDNNAFGGVDDPTERETAPPYAVPLRGIQIRIRIYDQDSRQVRQAEVVSDFTPE